MYKILYCNSRKEKLENELNNYELQGYIVIGVNENYIFLQKKDNYKITQNTTTTNDIKNKRK